MFCFGGHEGCRDNHYSWLGSSLPHSLLSHGLLPQVVDLFMSETWQATYKLSVLAKFLFKSLHVDRSGLALLTFSAQLDGLETASMHEHVVQMVTDLTKMDQVDIGNAGAVFSFGKHPYGMLYGCLLITRLNKLFKP